MKRQVGYQIISLADSHNFQTAEKYNDKIVRLVSSHKLMLYIFQ